MPTPKIRIMIVEDDELTSTYMASALTRQGYEPIVVSQSSQAIKIAEATLPQAFLLDLVMPPPDGFRLCRMLREHPNFRLTPILIVTSLNKVDSKIVVIGAGANDYLVKPFRSADLIRQVQDLLEDSVGGHW